MVSYRSESWLYDVASKSVEQWLRGWRSTNASASLPHLRFADHLGGHARAMAKDMVDEPVLLYKRFASAGYKGVCVCGKDILDVVADSTVQRPDEVIGSLASNLPQWMLEAYRRESWRG